MYITGALEQNRILLNQDRQDSLYLHPVWLTNILVQSKQRSRHLLSMLYMGVLDIQAKKR